MSRQVIEGSPVAMRRIYIDEDLSGKTFTAVKRHARRSLFRNCNIDGLVLVGDWRGTEYYGNTGACDWRQAQTYGSRWKGNTLDGSKFPSDLGNMQHEPVAEILRQKLGGLMGNPKKEIGDATTRVKDDMVYQSWDKQSEWWDKGTDASRRQIVIALTAIFAPYPNLLWRFERAVTTFREDLPRWEQKAKPFEQTLIWPQEDAELFKLHLDFADGLPAGVDTLWDVDQYIFAQTGRLSFTYTARPLVVRTLPRPDSWLKGWSGY